MTLKGAYISLDDLMGLRHDARVYQRSPTRRSGSVESRQRGRGVDFDEVRPYRPGDDARHIDWRVTARKVDPHTRVFREEREHSTFLLIDQTRSMFFGSRERFKSVAAAETATIEVWRSFTANDRIGGAIVGPATTTVVKPTTSLNGVNRLLNAIVSANRALNSTVEPSDWHSAIETTRQFMQRGHRIVAISDFSSPTAAEAVAVSNRANRRSEFVMIADPLERVLPETGMYAVAKGDERVEFDAGSEQFRREFVASFDERRERVESVADRAGMRFQTVETCVLRASEPKGGRGLMRR